jgi:hypothetical protein
VSADDQESGVAYGAELAHVDAAVMLREIAETLAGVFALDDWPADSLTRLDDLGTITAATSGTVRALAEVIQESRLQLDARRPALGLGSVLDERHLMRAAAALHSAERLLGLVCRTLDDATSTLEHAVRARSAVG